MAKTTSSAKKPSRKVWRIFRFKERFELPDDFRKCRVTPLLFTKDFVGIAAGDEAAGYHNQFQLLCNGDGLQNATFIGLYRQLVNLAACHSRAKRGYLLDAKDDPLFTRQIAKLLNVQTKDMARILKRFAAVDLLEYVELPEFDMSQNDPPDDTPAEKDDQPDSETKEGSDTKKSASKGRKRGTGGNGRKGAEISAEGCAPLINDKRKAKGRATSGLTAPGCKKNLNGKGKEGSKSAEALQGSNRRQSPSPPTTPPLPSEPHGSDEGGRVVQFARPPDSADISRQGRTYGRRVYLALGLPWDLDSLEAAREIGSFASKHDQICSRLSGLSPPVVDSVLVRGLCEATKVAHRKANKNLGAVWNSIMDKLAESKRRAVS